MEWFEFITKYYLQASMGFTVSALVMIYRREQINRKESKEVNDVTREAMRDLLRDHIIGMWRVCKAQSGLTMDERDSLEAMYKSYHRLKGNGNIDDLYLKMRASPIVD